MNTNSKTGFLMLSVEQMAGISNTWVASTHRRKIEKIPAAKGFLPCIEREHRRVLAMIASAPESTELVELQVRGRGLDDTHDRFTRGPYFVLTGYAEMTEDEETKAAVLAARDELTPNGLATTGMSYRDEAGVAAAVAEALSPETKATLKKIPAPGGTLLDAFAKRVDAAQELSDLEARRDEIAAAPQAGEASLRWADARFAWIRTARAFVAIMQDEDVPAETRDAVLKPLYDALERSGRRGGAASMEDGSGEDAHDGAPSDGAAAPVGGARPGVLDDEGGAPVAPGPFAVSPDAGVGRPAVPAGSPGGAPK